MAHRVEVVLEKNPLATKMKAYVVGPHDFILMIKTPRMYQRRFAHDDGLDHYPHDIDEGMARFCKELVGKPVTVKNKSNTRSVTLVGATVSSIKPDGPVVAQGVKYNKSVSLLTGTMRIAVSRKRKPVRGIEIWAPPVTVVLLCKVASRDTVAAGEEISFRFPGAPVVANYQTYKVGVGAGTKTYFGLAEDPLNSRRQGNAVAPAVSKFVPLESLNAPSVRGDNEEEDWPPFAGEVTSHDPDPELVNMCDTAETLTFVQANVLDLEIKAPRAFDQYRDNAGHGLDHFPEDITRVVDNVLVPALASQQWSLWQDGIAMTPEVPTAISNVMWDEDPPGPVGQQFVANTFRHVSPDTPPPGTFRAIELWMPKTVVLSLRVTFPATIDFSVGAWQLQFAYPGTPREFEIFGAEPNEPHNNDPETMRDIPGGTGAAPSRSNVITVVVPAGAGSKRASPGGQPQRVAPTAKAKATTT